MEEFFNLQVLKVQIVAENGQFASDGTQATYVVCILVTCVCCLSTGCGLIQNR